MDRYQPVTLRRTVRGTKAVWRIVTPCKGEFFFAPANCCPDCKGNSQFAKEWKGIYGMSFKDNHVNARGNSKDRAARKKWMLSHFGNGVMANCWECRTPVDYETMVIDRIIPGKDGGRYVRGNIRPQCNSCSRIQGYEYGIGRIHKEMAGVV